jgi:hypothetical protein
MPSAGAAGVGAPSGAAGATEDERLGATSSVGGATSPGPGAPTTDVAGEVVGCGAAGCGVVESEVGDVGRAVPGVDAVIERAVSL